MFNAVLLMSTRQSHQQLYRVSFYNQGEVYEVYARSVYQSGFFGFVEIEELVFGERTTLVVDPAEERLAEEFAQVKRSYIPMHSIIRIDEVEKKGQARITPADNDAKVHPFPVYSRQGPGSGENS